MVFAQTIAKVGQRMANMMMHAFAMDYCSYNQILNLDAYACTYTYVQLCLWIYTVHLLSVNITLQQICTYVAIWLINSYIAVNTTVRQLYYENHFDYLTQNYPKRKK